MIIETSKKLPYLVLYYQGIDDCINGFPEEMWNEIYRYILMSEFDSEIYLGDDPNTGNPIYNYVDYDDEYVSNSELSYLGEMELVDTLYQKLPYLTKDQQNNIIDKVNDFVLANYSELDIKAISVDCIDGSSEQGLIDPIEDNDCYFGYFICFETKEYYQDNVINKLALDILDNIKELQTLYFKDKDRYFSKDLDDEWELPTKYVGFDYED